MKTFTEYQNHMISNDNINNFDNNEIAKIGYVFYTEISKSKNQFIEDCFVPYNSSRTNFDSNYQLMNKYAWYIRAVSELNKQQVKNAIDGMKLNVSDYNVDNLQFHMLIIIPSLIEHYQDIEQSQLKLL